ncbi:MAG: Holliday junction branch migration protein RuvA [Lautropia sp.]
MIGRLAGTLLEKNPPEILLDVNGVGYELQVPMSTFYDLPDTGGKAALYTHLTIREDAHLLFGFLRERERTMFRELIRVSGVGPRTALAVLSGMSTQDLVAAVSDQEAARLTRVPGIGKKTAERLLLELKGRLAPEIDAAAGTARHDAAGTDVLRALVALGYSEKESSLVVGKLALGSSVEDGIRQALKLLTKTP